MVSKTFILTLLFQDIQKKSLNSSIMLSPFMPDLQLNPRSREDSQVHTSSSSKRKNNNPFGDAKPREENLANKGIDFHVIDDRIDKRIHQNDGIDNLPKVSQ